MAIYAKWIAIVVIASMMLILHSNQQSNYAWKRENTLHSPIKNNCYLGKYCIKYIISPKSVCSKNNPQLLFSFILSRMSNFGRRQTIRDTWANSTLFRESDLRIVFVLGKMKNYGEHEKKLNAEANKYNDLVLVDFVEHYYNLTLKTISGLHWVTSFCPEAQYVLKTDDDIVINMFVFLSRLYQMKREKKVTGILSGDIRYNSKVMRYGRYRVPVEEYAHNVYPDYLFGTFYLMTSDVVKELDSLIMTETSDRFLRMEDVLITGVYAAKANVTRTGMTGAWFWNPGIPRPYIVSTNYRQWYMWHGVIFSEEEKRKVWSTLFLISNTSIPYTVPYPESYNYLA